MFKLTLDTPIPSIRETVEILQRHVNAFGVPLDYDRMQEYNALYTIKRNTFLKKIITYTGSTTSVTDYKDSDFLKVMEKAGCIHALEKTPKGEYSLSGDSVASAISKGILSKEIQKLLEMYSQCKSFASIIGPFAKIFETYDIVNLETFDNHRMIITSPTVVEQNTGRAGYQRPAFMNFAREIQDIITVPKGWIKIDSDSGQIDPRISQSWLLKDKQLMQCTNMYNDAYYGYLHYCNFLTNEERASGRLDLSPREITDEMKAKRSNLKTYGNSAMYGGTENKEGDPDKANFIKYIGGHPARVKAESSAAEQIMRGQTVFKTAFGTPIDIMAGPSAVEDKKYSEKEQFKRRVNRAINNPIQGTAADLFRYSVKQADRLLMRKAPNSTILAYVHDSGKFMIHEDEYDAVKKDLEGIVSYQVEDWIPIYGDYSEGHTKSDIKRFIE